MAVNLMLRVGIEAAGGVTFANPGADGADAREALQASSFAVGFVINVPASLYRF